MIIVLVIIIIIITNDVFRDNIHEMYNIEWVRSSAGRLHVENQSKMSISLAP